MVNDDYTTRTDVELAILAAIPINSEQCGRANAEIEARRRKWEEDQAEERRAFERNMFDISEVADATRKRFEAAELSRQIAAARELSDQQLESARRLSDQQLEVARSTASSVRHTVWATWAACIAALLSAVGTGIQAWAAFHPCLQQA
jgi:hypothetical protein